MGTTGILQYTHPKIHEIPSCVDLRGLWQRLFSLQDGTSHHNPRPKASRITKGSLVASTEGHMSTAVPSTACQVGTILPMAREFLSWKAGQLGDPSGPHSHRTPHKDVCGELRVSYFGHQKVTARSSDKLGSNTPSLKPMKQAMAARLSAKKTNQAVCKRDLNSLQATACSLRPVTLPTAFCACHRLLTAPGLPTLQMTQSVVGSTHIIPGKKQLPYW